MRFPKTIQLDLSDWQGFERAAGPGGWAVSGALAFARAPAAITGTRAGADPPRRGEV